MWLEAKIGINIIGWCMIAIVISQILFFNILFGFLLLAALFLGVFSDFLIGWMIKNNHADIIIDPNPSGTESVILCDFSGNVDFARVTKGPLGKREFVKYGKEASIIYRGRYPIRFPNGNHGFIGHEDYDLDVEPVKATLYDELKGDDIKEIVDNLPLIKAEGGVTEK